MVSQVRIPGATRGLADRGVGARDRTPAEPALETAACVRPDFGLTPIVRVLLGLHRIFGQADGRRTRNPRLPPARFRPGDPRAAPMVGPIPGTHTTIGAR